jgi:hypothetical protein
MTDAESTERFITPELKSEDREHWVPGARRRRWKPYENSLHPAGRGATRYRAARRFWRCWDVLGYPASALDVEPDQANVCGPSMH